MNHATPPPHAWGLSPDLNRHIFDFTQTRTPEEMALYDRFGPDYQRRVETFSSEVQQDLKQIIAYEVPNHPKVLFRNHADTEGLLACQELNLPPTPGVQAPLSPLPFRPPFSASSSVLTSSRRHLSPRDGNNNRSVNQSTRMMISLSPGKRPGSIPPNVLLLKPSEMYSTRKQQHMTVTTGRKKLKFNLNANQIRKMSKSYSDYLEQIEPEDKDGSRNPSQSSPRSTSQSNPDETIITASRLGKIRRISRSLTNLTDTPDLESGEQSDALPNTSLWRDASKSELGRQMNRASRIPRLKPDFRPQTKVKCSMH
eukprot:maker-scaffold2292_size17529-snap-gene-0.2 protein:Tk01124 transcript:maker-scaffold2292_size17529-snap-gene-0.2-mRNA-1 annotation:"---NA---"